MACLIKQGVCCYLNNSRRGGEQRKFDSLKNVFLCAELLIFGSACVSFFLSDISYLPFIFLQIPGISEHLFGRFELKFGDIESTGYSCYFIFSASVSRLSTFVYVLPSETDLLILMWQSACAAI